MHPRYYILLISLFFFSFVRATTSPVNDECTGAINIPTNSSTSDSLFTLAGATLSMPACTGTAYSDIWFKFTATGTRHSIWAAAADGLPVVVQVFQGSCGSLSSLLCYCNASGYAELLNLTAGTTYYYRLYLSGANPAQTSIQTAIATLGAAPSNDEVTGAIALKTDSLYYLHPDYATQSMSPCNNSGNEANDVWYSFVPKTATSNIIVTSPGSLGNDYVFQVFSGSPSNPVSLGCFYNPVATQSDSTSLNNLTVGQTYYIRIYNYSGRVAPLFVAGLKIGSVPVPVNDACTGAINIPTDGSTSDSLYSIGGATLSMPACTGTANGDIWFKFTPASTRYGIWAAAADSLPVVVQVFQGSCGSLSSVLCYSYSSGYAELLNLTPGTTYYYRVYLSGANPAQTSIQTTVTPLGAPPSNDEVTGAIALKTDSLYYLHPGYATQSMPPCNNSGNEANDVWYSFVPKTSAVSIVVTSPGSLGNDYVFQVFSGSPSDLVSLGCFYNPVASQPDSTLLNDLTVGQTYYIRIYNNNTGREVPLFTAGLKISSVSLPVNDEASGAVPLTIDSTYADLALGYATQSLPACNNSGNPANDVWYSFWAGIGADTIWLTPRSVLADLVFQVFSGTPSSLTSLACVIKPAPGHKDSLILTNLTAGKIYYIRVYDSNGLTGPGVEYDLKITGVVPANAQKALVADPEYSIYPNPAHDCIYIKSAGEHAPGFCITDLTGRRYLSGKITDQKINISLLPEGYFVLMINGSDKPHAFLFIKQ